MKREGLALALTLPLLAPHVAYAQPRGGHPAGVPRAAPATVPHAVPPTVPRAAPPTVPNAASHVGGGFDFQHDVRASQHPPGTSHPVAAPVQHPAVVANQPHRRIDDPRFHGGAWGWNRGIAWAPAPSYWSGGFWGAFALGAASAALGAIAYGTFVDQATNQIYPSYEVAPGSPGAILLSNYQLTQTPCGEPDLVVIFGPDNGVICAFANFLVAPGEYEVDPSTLTLVSQ
jgi:hypothetical protein